MKNVKNKRLHLTHFFTYNINSLLRTHFAFLALLSLAFNYASAQEREYIVTNYGDTIYGKVTRGMNLFKSAEVILNLEDEEGHKQVINPAKVKTVRSFDGVDGDSFITTIHDQWFIKRIVDGRIKIYKWMDAAVLFISKDDSEITSAEFGGLFNRKKSHEQVRALIQDNPSILAEFDTMKGSERNIFYIIEKYNNPGKLIPTVSADR